jgi:GR25 family glycosyltransferase involved in LPS biosynthesis
MFSKTMIVYTPSKMRVDNYAHAQEAIADLTLFSAIDSVHHYEHHRRVALESNLLTPSYIEQNKNITGKLGCNLSHIYVLQRFLQSASPWILVLEDDVIVEHYDVGRVSLLIQEAERNGSHYIQLYTNPRFVGPQREAERVANELYTMIPQWHTCAYLISREGARKTLSHVPLDDNIDHVFSKLIPELRALCYLNTMFACKGALHGTDTASEFGSIINDSRN